VSGPPASAPNAARLLPLTLDGEAGPLEALLQERDEHDHALTAVVCHPHPLYGGTMHNKVAHRVAATLHGLGAAVLRFNFRGVGHSAGTFDRGEGELADARTALAFLRERYPNARRWAAGFSFGSWVASRLAAGEPDVERLILVAPPVHTQTFEEMRTLATPKLVVQGTGDEICRPENLERVWPEWAEPRRLVRVPGASHFFDRQLGELAEAILEGLR
jgi:alpha/beta superfamily hydrolase